MTHSKHHKHHSVHEIAAAGVHGAHHARKHRKAGGEVKHGEAESPHMGDDDAKRDLHDNPERRNNAGKIFAEAEKRKHGGRAKRKHGGHVMHHHSGHVKHVGAVHGESAMHHAGRKPRKSGGRAGGSAEANPFSHARHGTPAKGRHVEPETMG